jgi:copper chaperone
MTTRTYTVNGMSCGHCVRAVTEEVGEVAGVSDVTVDLDTGKVTVSADGDLDDAAVREAVEEAGYEVVA